MMKTNQLIFLVGLLWPIASLAHTSLPDDGDNLYVYANGAAQAVTYSLDNLDKITFGDNEVSLWTNSGKTDYTYSQIELLTFRSGIMPATDIKKTVFCENDVRWMYNRNLQTLKIFGENGLSAIIIFDAQGRVVSKERLTTNEYQLSLENVPSGVYLVKVLNSKGNDTTIKLIK